MAFTKAASSDTDPSTQMRAYGTISGPRAITPLTAEISLPGRRRPGRSNLQIRSTNIPQPERTERDPDVAPARIARPSGQQGSTGNPLGDAIEKLGRTFRGAGVPTPLPTGVPGISTSDIPANTGFFSPITDALGFTTPPVFSDFTASLGALNEGGFVRKRT